MEKKIQQSWKDTMKAWEVADSLAAESFQKLKKLYQESHRAYHNLHHIHDLLILWERDREYLQDSFLISMVIFYHDAIYKPYRTDNELKSAELFLADYKGWQLPEESQRRAKRAADYILATKDHQLEGGESDLAWLLDADLSILGAEAQRYEQYTQQIREEYRMYPSFIYRRGRKAVIRRFLQRSQLYLTRKFRSELEEQARSNLRWELEKG